MFVITAALYGEITLRNGRVEQSNFDRLICVLIQLNSSLIRASLPRRKQESTMTLEFWIWRERGDFILSDADAESQA